MRHQIAGALWLSVARLVSSYRHHIETIPAIESNLASIAQYVSSHNGLDAPHVTPINASAYDWWYFDAYDKDTETSVVLTFFNAPGTGFYLDAAPPNDITEAYLFVSIPGEPSLVQRGILASESIVDYAGNGASGNWSGSGFSFTGEPDMSSYTVTIDNPDLGYKGELFFRSKAPGHYPCDRAKSGVTMEIMPNVGWANAVPDAVAEVHLAINDTKIDFTGVGYHDKNWGDKPFTDTVGSWFWGHGELGDYSIVWYDALTPEGVEYVSAYVAKDNRIELGTCSLAGIKVRPSGAGDLYPPSLAGPPPSGKFHIEIDLGHDGTMAIDVTPTVETVVVPGPVGQVYNRWNGKLKGGIVGQESLEGTALYEQFTLVV